MSKRINRATTGREGSINTWITIFLVVIAVHLIVIFSVMGFKMLKGNSEIPKNKEIPAIQDLKPPGEDYLINPPPEENRSLEMVLNSLAKFQTPAETADKENETLLPPVDVDGLISPPDPSEETVTSATPGTGKSPVGPTGRQGKTANSMEISGNYYIVVEGDTLSKIAAKTGTSMDEIRKKNHLDKDVVKLGQKLMIPGKSADKVSDVKPQSAQKQPVNAASTFPKTPAPITGNYKIYRVSKGDTLNKIATLFHTSPENLSKINSIKDPGKLKAGMEIKVPKE